MRPHRARHAAERRPHDLGQETVGQALLITAVSIGALSATQLSRILIDACQTMITALG